MNLEPTLKYPDWAAVMYVIGPGERVPVVLDRRFFQESKWKFPGGRKNPGETPMQTASRELREETGLWVSPEEAVFLSELDRKDHMLYLFGGRVDSFEWLKEFGDEGEEVRLVQASQILRMKKFFDGYKTLLRKSSVLQLSTVA